MCSRPGPSPTISSRGSRWRFRNWTMASRRKSIPCQGFEPQHPIAFLFLDQRRIHLEHVRHSEGPRDARAGGVEQRIAFVYNVRPELPLRQLSQSTSREFRVIRQFVELVAHGHILRVERQPQPRRLLLTPFLTQLRFDFDHCRVRIGITFPAISAQQPHLVAAAAERVYELSHMYGRSLEAPDRYAPIGADAKHVHEA